MTGVFTNEHPHLPSMSRLFLKARRCHSSLHYSHNPPEAAVFWARRIPKILFCLYNIIGEREARLLDVTRLISCAQLHMTLFMFPLLVIR